MARIYQSGHEQNSLTLEPGGSGGAIVSTTVRSGKYAFKKAAADSVAAQTHTFAASAQQASYFTRILVNIEVLPSTEGYWLVFLNGGGSRVVGIRITTGGVVRLWNIEDNAQVGSNGPTLSTNTQYRLELKVDTTTLASTAVEAKVNGTTFASGTINLASGIASAQYGAVISQFDNTVAAYFDDFAVNDTSGSFQNSWPGEGKIIHLRPNAAGDNAGGTSSTSGSSIYSTVDEVTPNDATDFNYMSAADTIDDFNIDASPLSSGDIINVVAIGIRGANFSSVGTTGQVVVRVKASSGGTVEESANILFNTTTYFTNSPSNPRNYPLVLYDLPGASTTAWTKADLETAQIGYRHVNTQSTTARISAVWMSVDYTPVHITGKLAIKPRTPQINWKI